MHSEGKLFDDTYRLTKLVGQGAMGTVYEATHARLAGRYAIKVLQQRLSTNPAMLALFDREARVTSLLQHPNIVQVIDHNTTADGTEYLVMEFLAGESLAERLLRNGPLPLDTVVGIVEQIAAGLAAAHAHGIVHRDLKPDNIFLVPVEGRVGESVKILDFGISKVRDPKWGPKEPEGMLMGTPEYMAPEQVEGRVADADAATDQFALAVITYEMLTGRNPFQSATVADVFSRVSQADPAAMGVGRDVELVVRRGLAKSNRQRFACVTDFSAALRAAATGRVREGQRSATIAYAAGEIANFDNKGRSRRRKWGLALAAAAVVSLTISFTAGRAANNGPSRVRALFSAPVAKELPRRGESRGEETAASHETARPVIVPLAAPEAIRPSPVALDTRPSQPRRKISSAPSRRPVAARFSVDEDATMPPSNP